MENDIMGERLRAVCGAIDQLSSRKCVEKQLIEEFKGIVYGVKN